MNKCVFTGRTTGDAELRYANNEEQTAVCNVSLAVDDGYGDKKTTSFFRLTIFGKRAEAFQKMVTKGTKIIVDCRAKQDRWKDNNGNDRSAIGFIVNDWEFAQSKGESQQSQAGGVPVSDDFMHVDDSIDEELPFN